MEHPIQGLMQTAMENIREMVDVNTIVGDPVQTPDGSVIMPISRVGFGFVAGGSDIRFDGSTDTSAAIEGHNASVSLPFGGGSGGGVSITPIAFLVVGTEGVKIVSLDNSTHLWERVMDAAPKMIDKIQTMFSSSMGSNNMGLSSMGTSNMGTSNMGTSSLGSNSMGTSTMSTTTEEKQPTTNPMGSSGTDQLI